MRLDRKIEFERPGDRFQHLGDFARHDAAHLVAGDVLAIAARGKRVGDPHRRLDAEIGLDEHVFEILQRVVVELPLGEDAGNVVGELARGPRQAGGQPADPAFGRRCFGGVRFRHGCCGRRFVADQHGAARRVFDHRCGFGRRSEFRRIITRRNLCRNGWRNLDRPRWGLHWWGWNWVRARRLLDGRGRRDVRRLPSVRACLRLVRDFLGLLCRAGFVGLRSFRWRSPAPVLRLGAGGSGCSGGGGGMSGSPPAASAGAGASAA